jgi:hypothetical protein
MSKRSFPWSVVAAAAIAGASFVGIASYVDGVRKQPIQESVEVSPSTSIQTSNDDDQSISKRRNEDSSQGSVRIVGRDRNEDPELSGDRKSVPKGGSAKVTAINESLKGIGYKEIRATGVSVDKGNAVIDMNPAVQGGFGSSQEADFIEILKKSLSQFPDVKTFQIRVDGQVLDTLGHSEMIEPIPVR